MRSKCRMVAWNPHGFKVGLCSVPPVGHKRSLCMLSNNASTHRALSSLSERFQMLWRRRSYAHHYTHFVEEHDVDAAHERLLKVAEQYAAIDNAAASGEDHEDETSWRRIRRRSVGLSFATS